MNVFLRLGLLSSSSSQGPCPGESLALRLEKLWFLCRPPGTTEVSGLARPREPSVVGASQNRAGAILPRAKGTLAPPDLSTVNPVARACNWKPVAAWVLPMVARGWAPGHSGPLQGLVLPMGSLPPATGGAEQSQIAEGKPRKVVDQALCSSLSCHWSQPLAGHCCPVSGGPACPFWRPKAKNGCFESTKGNDPVSCRTWLLSASPRKGPCDTRQSESPPRAASLVQSGEEVASQEQSQAAA